jgi:hypothetical protein
MWGMKQMPAALAQNTEKERFGDLGNRLGEFVEAMVEPAVVELFRQQGLDVNEVYPRMKLGHGRERIEIDLLVVDGDTAVAVECKTRLTVEDVDRQGENVSLILAQRDMP